jgi:hypothetical protein
MLNVNNPPISRADNPFSLRKNGKKKFEAGFLALGGLFQH